MTGASSPNESKSSPNSFVGGGDAPLPGVLAPPKSASTRRAACVPAGDRPFAGGFFGGATVALGSSSDASTVSRMSPACTTTEVPDTDFTAPDIPLTITVTD